MIQIRFSVNHKLNHELRFSFRHLWPFTQERLLEPRVEFVREIRASPFTLRQLDARELNGALVAALARVISWSLDDRNALFELRTVLCPNLSRVGKPLPKIEWTSSMTAV